MYEFTRSVRKLPDGMSVYNSSEYGIGVPYADVRWALPCNLVDEIEVKNKNWYGWPGLGLCDNYAHGVNNVNCIDHKVDVWPVFNTSPDWITVGESDW